MIGISTTIVKENRKMKTNKNDDFFNYFIRGLDSKAQPILNTQIPTAADWRKFDVHTLDAREILNDIL